MTKGTGSYSLPSLRLALRFETGTIVTFPVCYIYSGEIKVKKPLIVDIKRNSLDDGPGIRSTVFFKGCPLTCQWCQNPETINTGREIMFNPEHCIGCKTCEKICPNKAIEFNSESSAPINRERCLACGTCAQNCPGMGIRDVGRYYSVEYIAETILHDESFFRNSGGGITLSGGEPTIYPRYLERFLQEMRFRKIHINLETCGYYNNSVFNKYIMPYLDLIFFDIKFIDSNLHRRYTGKDNGLILDNFQKLAKQSKIPVLPRIPLIPGLTTTDENLSAIASFLRENKITKVALLPYNPTWLSKAQNLGKEIRYRHDKWLSAAEEKECAGYFKGFKIE